MPEPVSLRPATPADLDRVYAWANDPLTRAVSFSCAAIPYREHVAWFERQLERGDRNLMIATLPASPAAEAQPIAAVRLDSAGGGESNICIISINVAPEARGRGLGTATLEAASAAAAALGYGQIHALIRPDNHASVRAFTRAAYVEIKQTRVAGQPALLFIRDLA